MTRLLITVALALLLSGCNFLEKSPPTNFYIFETSAEPLGGEPVAMDRSVAVAQVRLPGYLDRPQIAVKTGAAQIRYLDFHRWSESLGKALTRTLRLRLANAFGDVSIVSRPWGDVRKDGYVVTGEILHFQPNFETGEIELSVFTRIIGPNEEAPAKIISLAAPIPEFEPGSGDYSPLALAMGQLWDQYGDRVAAMIREI